jgi:hypothetical protein
VVEQTTVREFEVKIGDYLFRKEGTFAENLGEKFLVTFENLKLQILSRRFKIEVSNEEHACSPDGCIEIFQLRVQKLDYVKQNKEQMR